MKWTQEESDALLALKARGASNAESADRLQRMFARTFTKESVRCRLRRGDTADAVDVDLSELATNGLQTWLIWSDAHVPFEDPKAFELVLQVARALKPHGQIVIGDFADMLSTSSHPKTPRESKWQLKDEVEAVRARRAQLDAIGSSEKHFFTGNHETRPQRLAVAQAMGLYDSLSPDALFELSANGWKVHKYQEPYRIGKVWFTHDCGHSGRNALFQNGTVFESSTVQGHTHHAGVHYFGNALGERHVSAVVGWLGSDEAAAYMSSLKITRNWQKAFGIMRIEPNGNSHVQVIPIVEYHCVVDGILYA